MAKRKIKPMKDDEVLAHVKHWLDDALDFQTSELSHQRAEALKYYFGQPFGNEEVGKSKVVSRDVQETVDWIMPSLMKVFTSGGSVVKYEPRTAEDVEQAEQETEYVNYLFHQRNPGFKIMHDWFQDALLMKTGIVKVYVEDEDYPEFNIYDGVDDTLLAELMSEENSELLAQTDNGDGTYAVKIKTVNTKRQIKVACVNPENFVIDRQATCIDDATFTAHREEKTVSWLRTMGVPEDVIDSLPYDTFDYADGSPEKFARDSFDGSGSFGYHTNEESEANRKVWVSECYINLDVDGDGFAELRRIVVAGTHIISNTEYDVRPFADITAHRIAHKFFGLSIYDKIKDIQELRSSLKRNIMDNIYRTNNGRWQVLDGQVNMDDLMSSEASGIVRVKSQNAVTPMATPQLSSDVFQMLDRTENERGKRTGVTDQSRGLDSNTLHSNQAAMSVNQVMSASEQQVDLIARMFAETGVKTLFQLLHDFATKYQDQEEMFQLRGKFIRVNPGDWRSRSQLTVTVGIGNMNKDQQLMHLQRMFEQAQAVIAGGGLGILVSEKNIYNLLKEMSENAGYKDVGRYWTDPDSEEAQVAKKAREEAESKPKPEDIKAQADMQRAQADAMAKQAEAAYKQAEAQIRMAEVEIAKQNATIQLREIALKEQQMQLDREKFMWERARDEAEFALEHEQARAVRLGDGKTPMVKKPRAKPENS
ncbi:portal protein [Pseudomonas phage BroderSalsa]|nr:portal protein [Pseudomonas phage BroderSalsa]